VAQFTVRIAVNGQTRVYDSTGAPTTVLQILNTLLGAEANDFTLSGIAGAEFPEQRFFQQEGTSVRIQEVVGTTVFTYTVVLPPAAFDTNDPDAVAGVIQTRCQLILSAARASEFRSSGTYEVL
jgi:hypothetical protein